MSAQLNKPAIRTLRDIRMSCRMAIVLDDLPPEDLVFDWRSGRLPWISWRRSVTAVSIYESSRAKWRSSLVESGGSRPLETQPAVSTVQLTAAREFREAINRLARPASALGAPDDRHRLERPLPVDAVLSTVARDAVDLLAGPLAAHICECAAEDCALLFVDASRPGGRRWCATEACDHRAREGLPSPATRRRSVSYCVLPASEAF